MTALPITTILCCAGTSVRTDASVIKVLEFEKGLNRRIDAIKQIVASHAQRDARHASPIDKASVARWWLSRVESDLAIYKSGMRGVNSRLHSELRRNGALHEGEYDVEGIFTSSFAKLKEIHQECAARFTMDPMYRKEPASDLFEVHHNEFFTFKDNFLNDCTNDEGIALAGTLAPAMARMVKHGSHGQRKTQSEYLQGRDIINEVSLASSDPMDAIVLLEFYPHLMDFFERYREAVFTSFLVHMASGGHMDFSLMAQSDPQRAREMLDNIDKFTDKRDAFQTAFQACPYLEDLYVRCADAGYMDAETYYTACELGFQQALPADFADTHREALEELKHVRSKEANEVDELQRMAMQVAQPLIKEKRARLSTEKLLLRVVYSL